jgi:NTE family protein
MELYMRTLILSGGGSKSAYSVGVLRHLLGELKIHYDNIIGVSSGAICAAFLAMFPHGEERECIDELYSTWLSLDNSKIFRRWKPFGRFHVLWKLGFFDNTPMKELIRDKISLERIRASHKKVIVGAVSLTSGKYTNFDQTSDDFVDAVISSASFPVMFEPVKIGDQLWSDGGIKSISPIHTAITLGDEEIDIITTSPEFRDKKWIKKPSIIDVMTRSFDLFTEKIMSNDIEKAVMYNQLVAAGLTNKKNVKINILRPDHNLVEDLLDFRPHKIAEMIENGYNDAKNKFTL